MEYLKDIAPIFGNVIFLKGLASVFTIVLLGILKWVILRIVEKNVADVKTRFNTRKTIDYVIVLIDVVIVARIWMPGFQSIATYFGLLSAGLAIALKDLIANFAGWLFIIWRKPFEIGNRIQINNQAGDVIDIRPFQFTILEIGNWVKADQSTGRIIHIPNGLVFTNPISNYDMGFQYIWNEIPVLITFESNWKKAKVILQQIVDNFAAVTTSQAEDQIIASAKKFLIFYTTLTPKIYTSVEESGVLLTIRYLTEIRKRRGSSEEIWESILTRFEESSDINLAYTTIRRVQ